MVTIGTPARGRFTLTTPFTSTTSNYTFTVTNVYAPADHRDSDLFLSKLASIEVDDSVPWLIVGDYNLA